VLVPDDDDDFEDDNLDDVDDREECWFCGLSVEECRCNE
jgi:hypothetical protein